jgi:hypothetical protein
MPTIKIDVDQKTYERLVDRAVEERRRIDWQAEVELKKAMERVARRPARQAS